MAGASACIAALLAAAAVHAADPPRYKAYFYVAGSLDESEVRPTVQEVTGRARRTFEQWAAAHASAFR